MTTEQKAIQKIERDSEEYRRMFIQLAHDLLTIRPCRECGAPYASSLPYICHFNRCENP